MKKIYIIGSLFVVACLIAIPMIYVQSVKAELNKEEVVLVTAGQVLGQGLLDSWEWGTGSDINLRAISSPDVMSPWFSFGGVRQWAAHDESLNAASTTACQLQSPAATSTLQFGSLQLTVSTTSISIIEIAKSASTNNTATTTKIGNVITLSASATNVSIVASTSPSTQAFADGASAGKVGALIFAPNEWLVFKMLPADTDADGTIGTVSPTGVCQAVWTQLHY